MPLSIAYESVVWKETLHFMHITIPLSDRYLKNVSIITTSQFIKVSSLPYFWECFLHGSVDCNRSIARVGDGTVTFELAKIEKKLWNCLKHESSNDKMFCREKRKLAMEEHEKKINSTIEKKSVDKYEAGRHAIRKQMLLDEIERKRIADTKTLEKQRMSAELKKFWQKENTKPKNKNEAIKMTEKKSEVSETPQPRRNSEIAVKFSSRVFPTAARESLETEEKIWLAKQAEARKSIDFDSSDLALNEKNYLWLQDKGNKLCMNKDYLAAINAYNLAIRMCSSLHSLYSSRAFCHLQLKNLHKVLEDSSKALELLRPCVPSNASERAMNHTYRAKAFFGVKLYVEGKYKALMDVEAALHINSNDEDLKNDAEELRQLIQNDS